MRNKKNCSVKECEKKDYRKGFCYAHYTGISAEYLKAQKRVAFLRCVRDAGWTEERFIAFNYAQGGLCYFCGEVSYQKGNPMRLCMDHNHETGEPRGLLCQRCNQFLWFYEDPVRAFSVEQYLGRK